MRKILPAFYFLLFVLPTFAQSLYPQITEVAKPWTYWWWQGCAVDPKGITAQLENFKKSGVGGAHIIPIYGVKGEESHFLPFLGKQWLDIFNYTVTEAKRLGLGIDLSTGTGWPFGGPAITKINGAKQLVFNEVNCSDTLKIREVLLKNLFADSDIFLINKSGTYIPVNKSAPIYHLAANTSQKYLIVTYEPTNQKVKRAAPGGEGLVVDHFDPIAMKDYLHIFDSTLFGKGGNQIPRAMYNDSYEVYKANWTTDFYETFEKQHHYDLKKIIYTISPNFPDTTLKAKVISDYRETLSSLLYDTEKVWTTWITGHQMISRYQAHGSPGNLLDLYALADIPETESFGSSNFKIPNVRVDPDYEEKNFGRPNPLMMKFASSPAQLLGKRLVASETTTWLGNHFKVALSQIKPQIDELFIAGINHIFYHGTTYSPPEEPFPGWLFYASTNYGSHSHFYNEFPLLNHYVENCQKLLQESEPDNDLLVYLPIYDFWANTREPLLSLFTVHHADKWFLNTPFGKLANRLWETGYSFDYISDLQISQLKINTDHSVSIGKCHYQTIVIPPVIHMPFETLKNLSILAKQGVKIIFDTHLPNILPGNSGADQEKMFDNLKIELTKSPEITINTAEKALTNLNIRHEALPALGLTFIRKRIGTSKYYFISNLSNQFFHDTISLSEPAEALEYYNPMNEERGFIDFKKGPRGIRTSIYLPPGSSCFLISGNKPHKSNTRNFRIPSTNSLAITKWKVEFKEGTPELPKNVFHPGKLTSWTSWDDPALNWYNGYGTYSSSFSIPVQWKTDQGVYLQIDDLRETARVTVNGGDVGTIWAVPYQLFIPAAFLKFGNENSISIKVRNLSANQARYLDNKGIKWKKFYDANMVDITYKPFDASNWTPIPSGILGEVRIVAINPIMSK